jgi:hypothetical protein
MFPYSLLPHHEKANQNTIGVSSAKLPHCTGHALTYAMKNNMPLVHHVIKQWGCSCMIKDNKGLNERT